MNPSTIPISPSSHQAVTSSIWDLARNKTSQALLLLQRLGAGPALWLSNIAGTVAGQSEHHGGSELPAHLASAAGSYTSWVWRCMPPCDEDSRICLLTAMASGLFV